MLLLSLNLFVFTDPPTCSETPNQHLVVARGTKITVSCHMNASPTDLDFTWVRMPPKPPSEDSQGSIFGHGGVITGDEPPAPPLPELIDLTPDGTGVKNFLEDIKKKEEIPTVPPGPTVPHKVDPKQPGTSMVTLTADDEWSGVMCFAKNSMGRTRVPCVYTLALVGKF